MTPLAPPLVLRFGAFGDMLLLVSFLEALQARYGQPCDLVSSGPWTEPLLGALPVLRELVLLQSRNAPYWLEPSQRRLVRWLRQRPPGPVYACEGDEKSAWLLRRAGVGPEWICSISDVPIHPGEHITARFHRFAAATPRALAGVDLPPPPPLPDGRLPLRPEDAADCERWLTAKGLGQAPLVLVQPGNKRTMRRGRRQRVSNVKYWPEAHWAEVIRGVTTRLPEARVLICGSPAEEELAQDIRSRCDAARVISVARELPIPRLLALVARAHSMISVDTGPAHAAAAMGCPLAVLFANVTNPHYYAPRSTGAAVRVLLPPPEAAAEPFPMLHLSPTQVLQAWAELKRR